MNTHWFTMATCKIITKVKAIRRVLHHNDLYHVLLDLRNDHGVIIKVTLAVIKVGLGGKM